MTPAVETILRPSDVQPTAKQTQHLPAPDGVRDGADAVVRREQVTRPIRNREARVTEPQLA
jgi:hypothetical protein